MARILAIDDYPDLLRTYVNIFGEKGHQVVPASDAKTCMNHLMTPPKFDIVVGCDVENGGELTREIRNLCPDLPIIMITTISERGPNAANAHFPKPFQLNEVLAKIAELVS